MNRLVL